MCGRKGLTYLLTRPRQRGRLPRSLIKSATLSKTVQLKQGIVDGLYDPRPDLAIRPCLIRLVSKDRDHSGTESGAGYEGALVFEFGWRSTPMAKQATEAHHSRKGVVC